MGLDPGFVLRYGLKHLGHAMADVVLHDELQQQQRDEHSYTGQHQVKESMGGTGHGRGQEMLYEVYQLDEDDRRSTAGDTHQQGHYQEFVALLKVPEHRIAGHRHLEHKGIEGWN